LEPQQYSNITNLAITAIVLYIPTMELHHYFACHVFSQLPSNTLHSWYMFDLYILSSSGMIIESDKVSPARSVWETSNDDDMCRLDDGDDFPVIGSVLAFTFSLKAHFKL
jgi:hypothetical protein